MTQEEKAKRYDEAIERARAFNNGEDFNIEAGTTLCEYIFPELKENEDERIRKELTEFLKKASGGFLDSAIQCKTFGKWRAWLEKQDEQKTIEEVNGEDYGIDSLWHAHRILEKTLGNVNGYQSDDGILEHQAAITAVKKLYEQKPVDKVEPKFHKGDWITNANGNYTWKVILVDDLDYTLQNQYGACVYDTVDYVNKAFHLWTIQDAKDGDVLVTVDDKRPFIYKGCLDSNHPDSPVAYCGIDSEGYFYSSGGEFNHWWTSEKVQPATKEQLDTLIKAMIDEGYTFDFNEKKLRKEEVK